MTMADLPPPIPAQRPATPPAAMETVVIRAALTQAEIGFMPAERTFGPALLQFTDGWVTVDVVQPRPRFSKVSPTARVVQMPFEWLKSVDIEGQPDRARGFSTAGALTLGVAGGFIGSGKVVQGGTRFVVATTVGWMLFRTGQHSLAVRAMLTPVLERLDAERPA